jgi:DNA-binding CsgD family transcriptional regulator
LHSAHPRAISKSGFSSMNNFDSLIDTIYAAAADPHLWDDALHGVARTVGGAGAFLVTRRADSWLGWRSSAGLESIGDYIFSSAERHSRATTRLLAFDRPGFVDAHELFAEKDYLADPLMTEWAAPAGLHHTSATAIPTASGDVAIIQVNRRRGEPRFGRDDLAVLDQCRPHLARAALLSARWRLDRLRAATEALELVGLPAAALDHEGKALAANALIQNFRAHVVWRADDRIALVDRVADARLRRALATTCRPGGARGDTFAMRGASADLAIAHLIPATGTARDLFGGAFALLAIAPLAAAEAPDAALLRGLYDLTPTEANVAIAVTEGSTLRDIAARRRVVVETVRTQIKSVFEKTGVTRQSQLAALLAAQKRPPFA